MSESLVAALCLGLFAGTAAELPVDRHTTMPTPQCVVCGPAVKPEVTAVYDWSKGRIISHDRASSAWRRGLHITLPAFPEHMGIPDEALHRLAGFSGV